MIKLVQTVTLVDGSSRSRTQFIDATRNHFIKNVRHLTGEQRYTLNTTGEVSFTEGHKTFHLKIEEQSLPGEIK